MSKNSRMSTGKKTQKQADEINQDVIRSALDTSAHLVSCRCDFNPNLSTKINKDNIRADVEENLAKLGLSIDKEVITLQNIKALKSRRDPTVFQYVIISLKIHDGQVADEMEKGLFAEGITVPGNKTSGFTVRWPGREKKNTRMDDGEIVSNQCDVVDSTVVVSESSSGGYFLYTLAAAAVVSASAYWLMKRHNILYHT